MRSRESAFRNRALGQAAIIVLLAGATAACSGSKRLSEPFFTGSTDNQRQIISQNGDYQPMPQVQSASVARSDLPPPADYGTQSYGTPSYGNAYASAAPAASIGGDRMITVGPSDTLDNLAAKYGVTQQDILIANNLSNAGQVTRGRTLTIPRNGGGMQAAIPAAAYAPAAAPIAEAPAMMASGGSYVVQPGDTLFSIARRNGTSVNDLVAVNGLASPEAIRIGQTLQLDGSGAMQPRPTTLAAVGAPEQPLGQLRVTSDGQPLPANYGAPQIRLPSPADVASGAQQAMPSIPVNAENMTQTAAIDEAIDPASTDGKSFRWPVRGRIIAGFGTKSTGERNDGINLAVPEGTSVKAAEAGNVIYSGNELEGYGNLILIRHADGFVTAYAHNKELLVRRGDQVRRGQTISYAGMSGSVTSPQVHFELRKGAKPINPLDYLAGT